MTFFLLRAQAADGYATIGGICTGGEGGPTVTVTNGTDFISQVGMTGPRIIQVDGVLSIGSATVRSDKTVIGLGTNATLLGRLSISGVTNVIVRNLRITNPGDDGISIRDPNTRNVWVDHVTFYDCGDGSCDISQGADYVTVSWCKFIYPTQLEHKFTMIADGQAGVANSGRITLHHNWWSTGSGSRMPASSYATVHLYNNYFSCTNNSYCSNVRTNTQFLVENSNYAGVRDPLYKESNGQIQTSGNIYVGTSGKAPDPGTNTVFTPPYSYTMDTAANVPAIVMAGAGAPGPDTIPIPPKVWDGGGANNNWNTANNWGFNETPKAYDTLVFAGNTRLTPNNNFTAGTQYSGLAFSNNAGAFVIGGNTLNLGQFISSDSATTQTINLNVNLNFATEHFTAARTITVSDSAGMLHINGNISGDANTFAVTKTGAGTLNLTGNNTFNGRLLVGGGTLLVNNTTGSGTGSGNVTVNPGATLGGNGTISGNVTNNGTLSPGISIGRLSIGGPLVLRPASLTLMELNPATNDSVAVAAAITYGGSLLVTNTGGALTAGAEYKLFDSASRDGSFSGVTLPALSPGLAWTNRLSQDGSITVVSIVNTTPTNITTLVNSDSLVLTWPEDRTGWTLQTNSAGVSVDGAWFDYPPDTGSRDVNQVTFTIDRTKTNVFFRLVYP